MTSVKRTNIRILPNPERVILKFLNFATADRIKPVVEYVLGLEEKVVKTQLDAIYAEFENRHPGFEEMLEVCFQKIEGYVMDKNISPEKKLLIGAYFTHEYTIEAAALFNPSIVPHPDQNGLEDGALRFILSLRATGEGHISSVEFQTGTISAEGSVSLDPPAEKLTTGKVVAALSFPKPFVIRRMETEGAMEPVIEDHLPEQFSVQEANLIINRLKQSDGHDLQVAKQSIARVFDLNYDLSFAKDTPLSSRVIFPNASSESNGMEDVRLVKFTDENKTTYLGTYTAYNGREIRPQLIETQDFRYFRIRPFYGAAASDKGMAIFPEKINGKYAMVGRQGGRCLSIMYSDDLHFWPEYQPLQRPERSWELLQIGNCGSPIKTSEGWLLLTHAVGPMRKYVLSFTLLDLQHPEKVLATLDEPFLSPSEEERVGYVPNVLYTCGLISHRENLIIPYAMSDRATSFAVVDQASIIRALLKQKITV